MTTSTVRGQSHAHTCWYCCKMYHTILRIQYNITVYYHVTQAQFLVLGLWLVLTYLLQDFKRLHVMLTLTVIATKCIIQ